MAAVVMIRIMISEHQLDGCSLSFPFSLAGQSSILCSYRTSLLVCCVKHQPSLKRLIIEWLRAATGSLEVVVVVVIGIITLRVCSNRTIKVTKIV